MYQLSYAVEGNRGFTYPTLLQAKCASNGGTNVPYTNRIRLNDELFDHCCCYFDCVDEVIGDILRHRKSISKYRLEKVPDPSYAAEFIKEAENCGEVIDWIINSLTTVFIRDVECNDFFGEDNPRTEYLFEGMGDIPVWYKITAQKI